MKSLIINNHPMRIRNYLAPLMAVMMLTSAISFAQDKEATMTMKLFRKDSVNVCEVTVVSENKPVSDVPVKIYVQRMFSLLTVGESKSTDESGIARFDFPHDIPGDANGMLTIFAKIEDDENYGTLETKKDENWGTIKVKMETDERSLSASRGKAPIYFIVASNLIIFGIWGTLVYVILQLFKIRKISRHLVKKNKS
jgi:hypothetical protein